MVGNSGVGKSSLLIQFIKKEFQENYNLTVGAEFASKQLFIDGQNIKLQIWDAAGQEAFKSIVKQFYRNAGVVYLVIQTLMDLERWLNEAKEASNERFVSVLIGNKLDKLDTEQREISYEDGVQFQIKHNITLFFQTSAKNGDNVENLFQQSTRLVYKRYLEEKSFPADFRYISLNVYQNNKNKMNTSVLQRQQANQKLQTTKEKEGKSCC